MRLIGCPIGVIDRTAFVDPLDWAADVVSLEFWVNCDFAMTLADVLVIECD